MEKLATMADLERWRNEERGELPACASNAPRIALVYPNTYAVGMSSLGYQSTLYQMRLHGLDAQRFLALAPMRSVDTGAQLHAFDAIAFSIAFELDYLHMLQFMQRAGLPLQASQRSQSFPLIFAGGVCVSMSRAPVWPYIDFFLHGEAEVLVPPLAEMLLRQGVSRAQLVAELVHLPGVEITAGCARAYDVTEFWDRKATDKPPEPLVLPSLNDAMCMTHLFSPEAEFQNMGLISIARGCPNHCTFCWIGQNAPDYRVASMDSILRMAQWQMQFTDRLGLVAAAVGAHPQIDEICAELVQRGAKLSYSSLRVEEVTEGMLAALSSSGQRSLTLAPETGSERLRRLLGKNIADERFMEVVDWALAHGMLSIKLYFMTGLPTETDEEAELIIDFVARIRQRLVQAGRSSHQIGTVTVNLGLFVPKPNLPLLRIKNDMTLAEKSQRLKRVIKGLGRISNVRVMASSPELAEAQGILSVDTEHSAAFLQEVFESGGDWRKAVKLWRRQG